MATRAASPRQRYSSVERSVSRSRAAKLSSRMRISGALEDGARDEEAAALSG
jgi:hypothetical protein